MDSESFHHFRPWMPGPVSVVNRILQGLPNCRIQCLSRIFHQTLRKTTVILTLKPGKDSEFVVSSRSSPVTHACHLQTLNFDPRAIRRLRAIFFSHQLWDLSSRTSIHFFVDVEQVFDRFWHDCSSLVLTKFLLPDCYVCSLDLFHYLIHYLIYNR